MNRTSIETAVGIFFFIGILCVGYLTIKLGKMDIIGEDHYNLEAQFESVTGLTVGSRVELAGVRVGKVEAIDLEPKRQMARVRLRIKGHVELTDDVIASVKTSGLIGDKYIRLLPGGSDLALQDGDIITETESALDLEELISKYVFGGV
ncbi:MAG: outer membrane lipid asymmetry maintenance protein MlaD [Desulfobacterales bacterium]|nr:outer membrane lipid asymmetry maintenance protein MlaD [Desulfobacterales bacterium]